MTVKFEWQEPPTTKNLGGSKPGHTRRQRELAAFAETLAKNPGRFALVGQHATAGGGASFVRRGLEVVTRKRSDGMYDMYVRSP